MRNLAKRGSPGRRWIAFIWAGILLSSPWQIGCVKEVCVESSAAFELAVTFEGVPWEHARRLMVISDMTLEDGRFDRRVEVFQMPSVTDNGLVIIVDPGGWTRDPSVRVAEYQISLRVLDENMVLLAQGSATLEPGYNRCRRAEMTVSGAATVCSQEGDPCVGIPDGSGGGHRICSDRTGSLQCAPSTCGDGLVDRLAGELCDPGLSVGACNDVSCMPSPQVVDLAISPARRYRRHVAATCPNDYTHRALGAYDPQFVDPLRATEWEAILPASLAVGDFHGTTPAETSTDAHSSGQELALGAPTGWWDPAMGNCERDTSDPHDVADRKPANRRGKVLLGDLPLAGDDLSIGGGDAEPPLFGEPESLFGHSLAVADLNGDGVDDLAISAPVGWEGNGYVLVALGRTTLAEDSHAPVSARDDRLVTLRNAPSNSGSRFGHSLATGDLDGDGYAELIIGSPGIQNGSKALAGAVHVVPGGPGRFGTGLYEVGATTANPAVVRLLGKRANSRLGSAVAVGDVDGDGYRDLVVGVPGATSEPQSQLFAGAVQVLFGGPDLLRQESELSGPSLKLECDTHCDTTTAAGLAIGAPTDASPVEAAIQFGSRVAVGDLDGDGRAEVVVSRPVSDALGRGVVYVYRGETLAARRGEGWQEVTAAPDLVIHGPPNNLALSHDPALGSVTGFGYSLLIADVNEDLQPDLIIAAPLTWIDSDGAVPPRPAAGAVYVIMGTRRSPWSGALDLAGYEDGAVDADNAAYGVVVLRGPVIGAQMGIALAAGFRVLEQDAEPNAGLLLALANDEEYALEATGGLLAVGLTGVFDRYCGNGLLELGEQCDCPGGTCAGDQAGGLTCANFGYEGNEDKIPSCTAQCRLVFDDCPVGATAVPCALRGPDDTEAVEIITQCNENGRVPVSGRWGVTCLDLGFVNEGELECFLSQTTPDGSCLVDLDSCES